MQPLDTIDDKGFRHMIHIFELRYNPLSWKTPLLERQSQQSSYLNFMILKWLELNRSLKLQARLL